MEPLSRSAHGRYLVVMSPLFALAFILAIGIVTLVQVIKIAVKPAYQQVALRSVYAVSVIVIIALAGYWLLNTPTAMAPVTQPPPA
jgi:hypothetical protein